MKPSLLVALLVLSACGEIYTNADTQVPIEETAWLLSTCDLFPSLYPSDGDSCMVSPATTDDVGYGYE